MKLGKILVIEGVSNTGKTTLCTYLLENMNFKMVPEAIRYLEQETKKQRDAIMKIPTTYEDECRNQEILFEVELQRLKDANDLAEQGFNVVIDKSALSIIATAYAFGKIMTFKSGLKYSIELYRNFLKKLNHNDLRLPNHYILLTAGGAQRKVRNTTRPNKLNDIWTNDSINVQQEKLLKYMVNKSSDACFIINNERTTTKQVANKILTICFIDTF